VVVFCLVNPSDHQGGRCAIQPVGARNLGLDSLDFFHPEEAALSFAQDVTSGGRRRLMQGPMWPSQFTPTMYCAFFFCLRLHQCFTGVDGEMFLKVYPGSSEGFPS